MEILFVVQPRLIGILFAITASFFAFDVFIEHLVWAGGLGEYFLCVGMAFLVIALLMAEMV